ncbi:hypothetical protein E2C01_040949 [Portunus trituberculatus]|uniref:Uncharacterized protein n=1 Tax=Portunus trituberculatus TaxID=210409 RepID=A0A5B7FIR3_PORTR|nr:hypothetical protein [Portunus trituberculatus]
MNNKDGILGNEVPGAEPTVHPPSKQRPNQHDSQHLPNVDDVEGLWRGAVVLLAWRCEQS